MTSPLKASQSTCDLSKYTNRNESINRNFTSNQGKSNSSVNLLTILSHFTNTNTNVAKENEFMPAETTKGDEILLDDTWGKNYHFKTKPKSFGLGVNASREQRTNSLFNEQAKSKKRPNSLDFSLKSNLSLPDSPIYDKDNSIEGNHFYENSESIRQKHLSYGFYVNLKSDLEKKIIVEKNQKEKEQLLVAHDQMSYENLNLRSNNEDKIEKYLEEFKNGSDDEFSSDSLESESIDGKFSRKCFSDYQIFSKTFRRSSLCSQKNSEDFSDTDFSGLNSLQGSGDLLEMQERDCEFEEMHQSDLKNSPVFRKSASFTFKNQYKYSDSNKSLEYVLDFDGIKKAHDIQDTGNSDIGNIRKKADAFYVEIFGSSKKHKPVLRTKTLPIKGKLEKTNFNDYGRNIKTKPLLLPKPIISCSSKKSNQLTKKLSIDSRQAVLPNKISQGIRKNSFSCLLHCRLAHPPFFYYYKKICLEPVAFW